MKKSGFTIVELLLCIAIIGIVSALGMNIAKKSTAKAFNLFFYSAYVNLTDAINYAEENRADEYDNALADVTAFKKNLVAALSKTDNTGKATSSGDTIETSSGIKYTIGACNASRCNITAEIPQAKTRTNGGHTTFRVSYIPSRDLLVPISGGNVDILNRIDLLPVYIDDGLAGAEANAKPIRYYSFKTGYCALSGNANLVFEEAVINCSDVPSVTPQPVGILKIGKPSNIYN